MESFYDGKFTFEIDVEYIDTMINLIIDNEGFFIEVLRKFSPKFDVKSMNLSYIIPMYIALAEMFIYPDEIPGKVSINEAVELAKVYSDDSGKKIVNGLLNKALENHTELENLLKNEYPVETSMFCAKLS